MAARERHAGLGALAICLLMAAVSIQARNPSVPADRGLRAVGTVLRENGKPFSIRGFNLIGAMDSAFCRYHYMRSAYMHFNSREMKIMHTWRANLVRLQVNQRALAQGHTQYLRLIKSDVHLAEKYGFAVVLAMTDFKYSPCGDGYRYPTKTTLSAWKFLAPAFAGDPYVAFDLFNEIAGGTASIDWQLWKYGGGIQVGLQTLVNAIRHVGAPNLLLAGGTAKAETFEGIRPSFMLTDPSKTSRGIAYAVHAYQFEKQFNARTGKSIRWDQRFGFMTARAPVIATEWHFGVLGCSRQPGNPAPAENIATPFFHYLFKRHIGLVAWAFDVSDTVVVTNGTNWTWQPTRCGTAFPGSGWVLRNWFLSEPGA